MAISDERSLSAAEGSCPTFSLQNRQLSCPVPAKVQNNWSKAWLCLQVLRLFLDLLSPLSVQVHPDKQQQREK